MKKADLNITQEMNSTTHFWKWENTIYSKSLFVTEDKDF